MASEPTPPGAGREALMVWLKLIALLAGVFAFGLIVFAIRRHFH
jgi:hypothetical protein